MTLMQRLSHRLRRSTAALAALLGLAACGGGSQVVEFDPQRLLAFGDETSLINDDGTKYTINAVDDDGALDCASNPVWTQSLASQFGIVFPQCNPNEVAEPQGRMLAANGAKVADLVAQVNAFVASDDFRSDDLATMLIGANDILEVYAQYPAQSASTLEAELTRRGEIFGEQVNRVARAGAAVLVMTVPDLGTSPFGIAEKAAHSDTDRAQLMRDLTDAFNAGMRLKIINDGRLIGLVFGDEELRRVIRFVGALGFTDVKTPACLATAVLPACTSETLVEDASSTSWLWADNTRFSPGFHARLERIAEVRVRNNPF